VVVQEMHGFKPRQGSSLIPVHSKRPLLRSGSCDLAEDRRGIKKVIHCCMHDDIR